MVLVQRRGATLSGPRERNAASPRADGADGSQTITRALSVLRVLRDSDTDVGVTEVSRAVHIPSSTVHRILRTLVAAGYVVQNTETERYRLGREAYLLGRAAGHTLGFDDAMSLLEQLAEETGESVNLVVREADHGLVVLRVESRQPLRFIQAAGASIPLHCTSTGKVLLAFGADPSRELAHLGELERLTPDTITTPDILLEELSTVRARGFSVNKGERIPGVCGVAAPVLGPDGVAVAALAVQGPAFRMSDERIAQLAPLVMSTAESILDALPRGYRI